ncbi:MAG: elongation factor Ts [Mycoplasmataceae bacterium]|nr:elongation factor Ts [Mycoplasmataceae bacterium]
MSIEKIKELRKMSGAGMLDVKKSLEATNYDIDLAAEWLRTNGIVKAIKKLNRIASEGSIFVTKNKNKSVLIEINSETDFVASNELFISESNKISEAILKSDVALENNETVLSLKIDGKTIEDILTNMTAIIGEKISFRRFALFKGETGIYKHWNSKIGVIILASGISEEILKDVAMHIAAMKPDFLSKNDISKKIIDKETKLAKKELSIQLEGKPKDIQENIIKGKVNKILSDSVLLEQSFIKEPSKKIKDIIGTGKFESFVRYEVGEGIVKEEISFAEEVAKQVNQ